MGTRCCWKLPSGQRRLVIPLGPFLLCIVLADRPTNMGNLLPKQRLSEIMTKDSNPYLALRIQVESGGCHGFQYLMKLVTLPEQLPELPLAEEAAEESEIREDDTIFSYYSDDSPAPSSPDLTLPKIILDGPSLELLKGSKVDFTMELIGSQFKIVDNPLATSSCGCGTSFDIKI